MPGAYAKSVRGVNKGWRRKSSLSDRTVEIKSAFADFDKARRPVDGYFKHSMFRDETLHMA